MLQARLEEFLLHEGNLGMDRIHVFKYFLAFILEIPIDDWTESKKLCKTETLPERILLGFQHVDGAEGFLTKLPGGLCHDTCESHTASQQDGPYNKYDIKQWKLTLPPLPSDQISSDPLASVGGIHPNHGDVEHLAGLQLIEHVHVLLPDGFVDGEVWLVQGVSGLFPGLEILKHTWGNWKYKGDQDLLN